MKLIKPKYEIWEQPAGLEGVYKQIEKAGRVCYKSEDKITEDSAKSFVDRMINSGHGAMLEHGTVYLKVHYSESLEDNNWVEDNYCLDPYSVVKGDGENYYITSNYRVLIENNWLDDLKYLCEPTEYHAKRITVYFTCDRVTGESFLRHRVFSFARESTRYCNYAKDKFGNEVTFIIPCWTNLPEQNYGDRVNPKVFNRGNTNGVETAFVDSCRISEDYYFNLLNDGWTPQQARVVLPFAVKSPLVMTGFVDDWWGEYLVIDKATGLVDQRIHGKFYTELDNIDREKYRIVEKGFFPLRCSSAAHPQAQELAIPLRQEFIDKRIW